VSIALDADPFAVERARSASGLLGEFNQAGVLAAADVHVSRRLAQLAGEEDEEVQLAAALAVRGPRLGHVHIDLATVRDTTAVEADELVDLSTLRWPDPGGWEQAVAASRLVAVGEEEGDGNRPLRLVGSALYLDRYWREERRLAADILALSEEPAAGVRDDLLAEGLARLSAEQTDPHQRLAAAAALQSRFAVVAGGPGTGKTSTVARIVALLAEHAEPAGAATPLVALAAPTGKAAARLAEAVHEQAESLPVDQSIRAQLRGLDASTLHRLLGWRPGSHSRFRHHRGNRLPHDVVIVDESSMVSLSLMARLLEAVRRDARLILVGDPGQLTSVEAGAVLGDIVGPTTEGLLMSAAARARLEQVTADAVPAAESPSGVAVGDGIVVLERVHRFGGGIARVAEAIRRGDGDAVLEVLRARSDDVEWIAVDAAHPEAQEQLRPVHDGVVAAARAAFEAAKDGAASQALEHLGAFRMLCAHRRGDHGVATWQSRIEGWLTRAIEGFGAEGDWYVGRPLLVTENDYALRLFNGDTGIVVVASEGGSLSVAFERGGQVAEIRPTRLSAIETVYAMTIHKSQGSQFDTAAVVLPSPTSQILTRELLYTAVTRARERLIVVGTEDMVRAAVSRPVARASGLGPRLWRGVR
jgi:exodeoxyribonuclease V alpha subunit